MSDFNERLKNVDFKSDGENQDDVKAREIASKILTQVKSQLDKWAITQNDFDSYVNRVIELMKNQDADISKLSDQFEQTKKIVLATSFYARNYTTPEEIIFIKSLLWIPNSNWTVDDEMILKVMNYQLANNGLVVDWKLWWNSLFKFVWSSFNWLKVINEWWKWKIVKIDWTKTNSQVSKDFPLRTDIKDFTGKATYNFTTWTYSWNFDKWVANWIWSLVEPNWNVFTWTYKDWKPFEWEYKNSYWVLLSKYANWEIVKSQEIKWIDYKDASNSETKVYQAQTSSWEKFYILIWNTWDNTQKIQLAEKFAKDKNVNVRVDLGVWKYFISPTWERLSSPSSLSNWSINDNDILSKKWTKILSVDASYYIKNIPKLEEQNPTNLAWQTEWTKTKVDMQKVTSYLKDIWYILSGNEERWYTTIDWDKLKTVQEIDAKTKEISWNPSLEKKYSLLKELKSMWFSPEKKWENKYELDFYWLFDDSSITFEGNSAKIKTSWVVGKEFVVDITKWSESLTTITSINEYMSLRQKLTNIESSRKSYSFDGRDSEIRDLKDKITKLSTKLWIKN
jgi:hypothetical protein